MIENNLFFLQNELNLQLINLNIAGFNEYHYKSLINSINSKCNFALNNITLSITENYILIMCKESIYGSDGNLAIYITIESSTILNAEALILW